MKKRLRQKIVASFLLATFSLISTVSPLYAQEVRLIPAASGEVNVETAPYTGQQYQVQQANAGSWVFGTLGALVNHFLNLDELDTNMASWVANVIEAVIISLNGLLIGDGLTDVAAGAGAGGGGGGGGGDAGYNPQNRDLNYGALGVMGNLVDEGLSGPPNLQTAAFFKNELADNILSGRVFAATTDKRGTQFFDPVRSIWALFRNLAYIFMALILTVMGLMVMLRYKIDPRTTMTVSAALPRVAMAIVLIAFSYPLAGFIFDLARVLKAMTDSVFAPIFIDNGFALPTATGLSPIEPFQIFIHIANAFQKVQFYTGGPGIFMLFIFLIILVVLLFTAFSLFFTLVIRFANLFVQVIFAPFAFLWGMMPGQEDTVSRWFKSFLVNTLSFPAIYFLINFAILILEFGRSPDHEFGLPPGLGAEKWWGFERNIAGFVAFGIVLAATRVPEILEDAFDVAPSSHVARAGVEPGKIAGKIPIIGGLLK
jgi:hypothetical protein